MLYLSLLGEWRRRLALGALSTAWIVVAVGCTSSTNIEVARSKYFVGDYSAAAVDINAFSREEVEPQDTMWFLLEKGKILQDAGQFQASNEAFEEAYRIRQSLDDAAVVSGAGAANNTLAILSDDQVLDYEGTEYDRILMRQAVLINTLLLGEVPDAAVQARAVATEQMRERERLEEQVAESRRKAMDEAAKEKNSQFSSADVERLEIFQGRMSELTTALAGVDVSTTIPAACFPSWVALMANGDVAQARGTLKWFVDEVGAGEIAAAMLERSDSGSLGDDVYVFFEAGLVPIRIDGSVGITLSPQVKIAKVPLPVLDVRNANRPKRAVIESDSMMFETDQVGSVESVVLAHFKENLIYIWGRPILSAAIKATATAVAASQTEGWAQVGVIAAGLVWNAVADPDLRNWATLPANQQVAIVPRPEGSGSLRISIDRGDGEAGSVKDVELPDGPCFLYVRSTESGNAAVHVGRLKEAPEPIDADAAPESNL